MLPVSKSRLQRQLSKRDKEVVLLADQYIFRPGCPILTARVDYNKKRDFVVLRLSQSSSDRSASLYKGSVTVRVHETSGSFDHVVNITEASHVYVRHDAHPGPHDRKLTLSAGAARGARETGALR